jgi:F-type H+-transporting ATPase subunit gamma
MSRRRNLERHRHSLGEIRNIMNSMKTLAYMETRKLTRFLSAQHVVIQNLEEVVLDFLSFYPGTLPEKKETTPIYVLIGSERGFCGDFNHALLQHLHSSLQAHPSDSPILVAVGHNLCTLLEGDARLAASINGACVVEEVTSLLIQVASELTTLQNRFGVLTIYCLYHAGKGGIIMQELFPSLQRLLHRPARLPYPPILNQTPKDFLVSLTDHYLFAILHEILYASLMAENHHRVAHLEGAVKHLDEKSAELARQCNILRQEEIIEEIEVILLNAASLADESMPWHSLNLQDEAKSI